jgi:peptidoglycan/LPS O-acetylase OafA/YrhL
MTVVPQSLAQARAATTVAAHPYRFLGSYRVLLAMMVLVSHTAGDIHPALPPLELGNIGVFLFFVVSGFVICEACDVFYRGRSAGFLMNRALKIFPAYWAATILAYVVLLGLGSRLDADAPHASLEPWALFVNATLLPGFLKQGNNLAIITTTWAILVEFQFYVIAAVLFAIAPRFRNPGAVLASAGAAALAFYVYVWATGSQARFFGAFIHAPFFVFGAAVYFLLTRRSAALLPLAAAALLLAIHADLAYTVTTGFQGRPWRWPDGVPGPVVVATGLFVIGIGLFVGLSQIQAGARAEWIDKHLGNLTYAIYLVHQPLNILGYTIGLRGLPAFAFVLTSSIASAMAIHAFVERPTMGLRNALRGARLYD